MKKINCKEGNSMKSGFRYMCLLLLVFLFLSGTALAANYLVSGAPNPDANGLYVQNGTSDGVPKYTKGSWTLAREVLMGPVWIIRNGSDPFADLVYVNWPDYPAPSPDLPPNDGTWIAWSGGDVPELIVTLSPAQSVPTLGTWGVLIMATLLAGIAIIALIRKSHFPNTDARA